MRWTLKPKHDDEQVMALAEILKVDRLIAQLLLQRGITSYEEAKKFFRPQLSDLQQVSHIGIAGIAWLLDFSHRYGIGITGIYIHLYLIMS